MEQPATEFRGARVVGMGIGEIGRGRLQRGQRQGQDLRALGSAPFILPASPATAREWDQQQGKPMQRAAMPGITR